VSYKLYTDKPNKFNCDIQIEGTSLAKSKVRLVIETNDVSYMFKGWIENNGVCQVNIPKTKTFLPEGSKGLMRLEVIADDLFFEPWSSEFLIETDKKINVKVKDEKPKEVKKIKEDIQPKVKNEVSESYEYQKPKVGMVIKQKPTKKINETLFSFKKSDLLSLLK